VTLGVPVRTEFGWVSSGQFNLPGPNHGSSYIRCAVPGSAGEAHAWLSVYFPDAGWVPIDPQREKFFVDSHHFAFFSALDAATPSSGAWSADYYGTASPTGNPLANGTIEIVPGDGVSSRVTVHAVDTVHRHAHSVPTRRTRCAPLLALTHRLPSMTGEECGHVIHRSVSRPHSRTA